MSRKKKRFNDKPFELQHPEKWQELQKRAKNVGKSSFLGTPLTPGKTNQLWRWDTLEDVDPTTFTSPEKQTA